MYEKLLKKLAGLVIFKNAMQYPALKSLTKYMSGIDNNDEITAASAYSDFAAEVLSEGDDISEYIYRRLLFDDNIFIRKFFDGKHDSLELQLKYELDVLYELSHSIPKDPVQGVRYPLISASHIYFRDEYIKALPDAVNRGVGIYAKSSMFRVKDDGELFPVSDTKVQRLSELVGYERERRRIIDNTRALMEDNPAANALLYGDAGTGKSTTVKAITAEYASEGLRLIELERSQVDLIPRIVEKVSHEPLKFIIFIDDLTLSPDSAELSTLKTVLEGGVGTSRSNSVIYVTSNHRHLVKETAADRTGEINVQDNLQSVLGLSARFALSVTFLAPDRELYLEIVRELAEKNGIEVTDTFLSGAEAFAIRRSGRSARCAKQYVELIASGVDPIK